MKKNIIKLLSVALVFTLVAPLSTAFAAEKVSWGNRIFYFCRQNQTEFCDNFVGKTFFKDQTQLAQWYRFPVDADNATEYKNTFFPSTLKLELTDNATAQNYSNANISTSEINNPDGEFLFGEDTRVEVRMRYGGDDSATFSADPANPGTAQGSAGLLFWNYFFEDVDPEALQLGTVRDAFGFVWQDNRSVPNAGFWLAAVAQGMPGEYKPMFDLDISEYNIYALERRNDSMKYFINDELVHEVPLNQQGGITLPADSKLSVDMWVDNASYVLDFNTFKVNLDFNDLTQDQSVQMDYVEVTKL